MNISSLVRGAAETLGASATCVEAARLMRDARVGCVVVAEERRPVGVVTDRDIAVRVIAEGRDPERVRLAEVMSPRPVFLAQTAELGWALQLMRDLAVRRIPVVDERHELVGVVSLDDVIVALAGELGAVAETIRKEM